MGYKQYIDIFSALLTPVIATVTTYIAVQQYRNNRLKVRHDLYDRRLAVLRATNRFFLSAWQSRGFTWDDLKEFSLSKSEAHFLYDNELDNYLKDAYERGFKLLFLEDERKRSSVEDDQKIVYEMRDHQKWFGEQRDTLNQRFRKYLSLKALK